MADAQSLMICEEALRYANILHDCLDAARWVSKNIEPNSGVELNLTVQERKTLLIGYVNSANIHYGALNEFISMVGQSVINSALIAWNVDGAEIKTKIDSWKTHIDYALANIDTLTFAQVESYLDANVPQFIKIKRRWAL